MIHINGRHHDYAGGIGVYILGRRLAVAASSNSQYQNQKESNDSPFTKRDIISHGEPPVNFLFETSHELYHFTYGDY
jgi:hypothetical protein